eukprot:9074223-Lingulodinium_polyedra.AAC.1
MLFCEREATGCAESASRGSAFAGLGPELAGSGSLCGAPVVGLGSPPPLSRCGLGLDGAAQEARWQRSRPLTLALAGCAGPAFGGLLGRRLRRRPG